MGLLHLVQQHHRVGLFADGLGQHATLSVADIPRRSAQQPRDGELLLVLGHVDGGKELFAAEERISHRQRRLGLADAARADQQKCPHRCTRAPQVGQCG
ncbi:hypothetical protein D3C84_1026890 [compost metagenome]